MANLSAVLAATFTVSDVTLSPSPQIISRSVNNITLNGSTNSTEVLYIPFFQAPAAGAPVPFPGSATTIWLLYAKNLNTAAGNITLAYTPTGGASTSVILLPGGIFIYMQPAESAGGITAATLTAAAGTISCEVMTGF